MFLSKFIVFIAFCLGFVECYKILVALPTSYKSHWNIGSSIAKELAKKGHQVTLISPYELKVENVTNILTTREKKGLENFK